MEEKAPSAPKPLPAEVIAYTDRKFSSTFLPVTKLRLVCTDPIRSLTDTFDV